MQKITSLKYSIVIAACLFITACALRKSEPMSGKVVDASDPHVKNGQVLYHQYCQKCHPAGEAGLGPSVTSKPGFAKRFQIRHGVGAMPGFNKDALSKQDVKDIALYLRKLNQL